MLPVFCGKDWSTCQRQSLSSTKCVRRDEPRLVGEVRKAWFLLARRKSCVQKAAQKTIH